MQQCRVVKENECRSLLLDQNRVPYVTGCKLPDIKRSQLRDSQFRMIPSIVQMKEQVGLLLDLYCIGVADFYHASIFFCFQQHQAFLQDLLDAQALYLLPGSLSNFHNEAADTVSLNECLNKQNWVLSQLSNGGLAFPIREQTRSSIRILVEAFPLQMPIVSSFQLLAPGLSL